ncbi:rRNA maturation RNase YbeY [Patescibacteria group bacterium]|nr:rRNA maturation RNase YbeY [Patescibacteria group bacterium]MBU0879809.1 rRNA maturation RNase YbeY [Patescibacteria group bacterium]MBU0880241.1 rRNA maturation RNase YbeY [Patescibacteria group bacterium]MBU1062785.1 rRNA maturation RNase YbeY [Patescibacteria group bacterium]MBU1783551.1 rRNA maturation RNase YbeY [Patescibacteria group bacterium]
MLVEVNNQTKKKINLTLIKKTTELFLQFYNLNKKEVSIAFVNDLVSKKLNKTYRGIDKPTDVLSFSMQDVDNKNFLGEIIINYEQIIRQAKQAENTIQQELIFILVHGLLHLIGYDDATEKGAEKMEKLGKEFIKTR